MDLARTRIEGLNRKYRRGDEDILLCWKVGEPEVAFWHGVEEGFAGRKPLPLD